MGIAPGLTGIGVSPQRVRVTFEGGRGSRPPGALVQTSSAAVVFLLVCAAGALSAGCGQNDNVVYGSITSADTTKYPDATIPDVHSAIHFNGTVTNTASTTTPPPTVARSVVILSGQDGLCDSLKNTPDYFKSTPQGINALILMTPTGIDGDFLVQAPTQNADASLVVAIRGQPSAVLPATGGDVNVTEFNTSGNAKGSFSLLITVPSTGAGSVFYGRFKTTACPAIAGAYLPFYR
jgi:hypothetical protein